MTTQIGWRRGDAPSALLDQEWLVTNALGGYACGTVAGACTRRFHGALVAALPAPFGRAMMLNHLLEEVTLPDGSTARLSGDERPSAIELPDDDFLSEFRLEYGMPVWRYEKGGVVLEKRIIVPHQQNTSFVVYELLESPGRVVLRVRPSIYMREHEGRVCEPIDCKYVLRIEGDRCEVVGDPELPALRMRLVACDEKRERTSARFVLDGGSVREIFYRVEKARGYDCQGPLWSPGYFEVELATRQSAALAASVESWEAVTAMTASEARAAELERRRRLLSLAHPKAQDGLAAQLVLAADQFIIVPQTRVADAARAHALGDDARTVIAGYHWFTDWGRDTMISLEGLALATGRRDEAGYILRTFAHHVRDGLIPNLFPEGGNEGLYHTADATMWLFHAFQRYFDATGDRETLRLLLPTFEEIVERHVAGTRFGIHVDPSDGLLTQGAEGYQLTWMDAKVGDWVVTPRRGKAVEINALFYNALRLLQGWLEEAERQDAARAIGQHAQRLRASFNRRFWNQERGHLFDVVDGPEGDDPSLRPNQLFAISLPHPVLDEQRWAPVVDVCKERLLTPVGLRSLDRAEKVYKSTYDGDLHARDAAYHQGTVWGWLIGPFVDAWLRVHPGDRAGARKLLEGFGPHLATACIGTISEIFDAEPPFHPRGCVAQAWSVAEVLRCWIATG